ncbi:MAG: hypothetical protein AAFQ89_24075 [Cyanobacteria bacterium J06626_18]
MTSLRFCGYKTYSISFLDEAQPISCDQKFQADIGTSPDAETL